MHQRNQIDRIVSLCLAVSASAAAAQPLFVQESILIPAQADGFDDADPLGLVAGDVNGDRLPELIAAQRFGSRIYVMRSERPGAWGDPELIETLPDDALMQGVVSGDVNADGIDDLVYWAGYLDGGVRSGVLLALGDGTYAATDPVEFTDARLDPFDGAFQARDRTALDDVTGDGIPDLVFAADALCVLPGDGAGGFATPELFGSGALALEIVDIDGDRAPEVIQVDGSVLSVWQRSNDAWVAACTLDLGFSFDLGAILSTPRPDEGPGVRVFLQEWGRFRYAFLDLSPDLSIARGPEIVFTELPEPGVIADLLGGAAPDLVMADGSVLVDLDDDGIGVYQRFLAHNPGGGFTGDRPYSIVVDDLNADGRPDVAVGAPTGIIITYGTVDDTGSRTLRRARLVRLEAEFEGGAPIATAAGDLDGDGRVDVVSSGSNGRRGTSVHLSDPDGGYTSIEATRARGGRLTVADADEDGLDDILLAPESNRITIQFSDPGRVFTERLNLFFNTEAREAAVGDVLGDASPEIVVQLGRGFSVLRRTEGRVFEVVYEDESLPISNGYGLALADIDSDGLTDIVLSGGAGPGGIDDRAAFTTVRSNGDGTFGAGVAHRSGAEPQLGSIQSTQAADLDGDGDADIVVGSSIEVIDVYENDGSGGFTHRASLDLLVRLDGVESHWCESVRVADIDGDGHPDLVAAGSGTQTRIPGTIHVYQGDGAFGFEQRAVIETGVYTNHLAVADLDGDGRPEPIVPMSWYDPDFGDTVTGFASFENLANPRTRCPADYAEPAGVLDLSDITAFVEAFVNGDPEADLSARFGYFDLADLVAFVETFVNGCG